jgi:release factor glutamine methyltransferase
MSFHPIDIAQALRAPGVDPVDARMLLQHVLGVGHAYLIAHSDRTLDDDERDRFLRLYARRRTGEPVAYLIGWREFYGRRFRVDPSVLIPRPETELLIDLALERIPADRPSRVLDLGTGSGNIAVTLGLERPRAQVIAIDVSAAALACATSNAAALGASNVESRQGSWFEPVAGERFDLIVSNPPYVAEADSHLGSGDVRFEPIEALVAGVDGLDCIGRIAGEAGRFLVPGGWLLFEHGYDQASACAQLLDASGFRGLVCTQDFAGHLRVAGGTQQPQG